jgi:flagellar hook-associated protein 3 FlgL
MRITSNLAYNSFLKELDDIQGRKLKAETQLNTGRAMTNLSDDPKKLINVKNLSSIINRNDVYQSNLGAAVSELSVIDEQLRSMGDKIDQIKQNGIDATNVGNHGNLPPLATYVKGLMEDLVKDANQDFNGHYVYSGTLTTTDSIASQSANGNPFPFEIIEGAATANNPSGLQVVFKGNNKDRAIHKDAHTTEVINVKANEIFGENGSGLFDSIIKMYNLMMYNGNGEKRSTTETFSVDDEKKMSQYFQELSQYQDMINRAAANNGTRYLRLTSVGDQISSENLLLKEYRSGQEDTDVAKTTIALKREETALQYSLQVGSKMMQLSLFDFLR